MNIDFQSEIYGVLGYPVKHSKSPYLFNHIFNHYKINAYYNFYEVSDLGLFAKNIKNQNIKGLSVTLPYKALVLKYLDELDPLAQKLKCINSIINDRGKLKGYNFDGVAAVDPLTKTSYWKGKEDWKKKKVLFLGLGGAAQGIILTLLLHFKHKEKVGIVLRDLKKAITFKNYFKKLGGQAEFFTFKDLTKEISLEYDIIINTTPVGMFPYVGETPFSKDLIYRKHLVYDIVYNPLMTQLLKEAKSKGAKVISGLEMFLGQAALQFELWQGKKISLKMMEKFYHKKK